MLRWFNSDPVFWAFLLGVVALADAMGAWAAVRDWPRHNVSVAALVPVTFVVMRQFLRVWRR
jgi:hypothetical protein